MRSFWLLLLLACSPTEVVAEGQLAPAPLDGKADGGDAADHSCRVVLRSVTLLDGASLIDVDVATTLGATGAILSHENSWLSYDGLAIGGAPGGYQRYRVRLEHTAEIAPYAKLPGGGRLFDHNRQSDDLANYVLNNGAFADDGVCAAQAQPLATLEFRAGYTTAQHGALVRGGQVSIHYDLARLQTCRSTHNGSRFWSLEASVKFQPSGVVSTGTVVASNAGTDSAVPFLAQIPDGSSSAELWFHNYTPGECDGWDSNFGKNYVFPVAGRTAQPGWVGDWGSSFARDCIHQAGVSEPAVIDEYVRERACSFVDADVWVPGAEDHPEWIGAQVEWQKDAAPLATSWLDFAGRAGNNSRFRWTLPYEIRNLNDWSTVKYRFRFSTDGNSFLYGGSARTIVHAP